MTVKYITINHVCKILNISRRTLERWRSTDDKESGKKFLTPDLYIGRGPRWKESRVHLWAKENLKEVLRKE